jgi:hypothetical protein
MPDKIRSPPGKGGNNTALQGYLTAANKAINKNNNVMPCNPTRADMSWWLVKAHYAFLDAYQACCFHKRKAIVARHENT